MGAGLVPVPTDLFAARFMKRLRRLSSVLMTGEAIAQLAERGKLDLDAYLASRLAPATTATPKP